MVKVRNRTLRRLRRTSLALVLYVQIGYPALIMVLARLRRRPPPKLSQSLPSVTVVIAAWNEETVIAAKLQNALAADYPAELLQVIVAADGSTDRTAAIARAVGDRVTVTHAAERRGKTAAVDRACALATGDVVVFSDANNLYRPETIRRLVKPFDDPAVGAVSGAKFTVTGPEELRSGERLYWRYESLIKEAESRVSSCTSASGEVLAVRRGLLAPLREDTVLDDFERILVVLRKGYKVAFAPEAISIETTSASLSDEATRRARITAARWKLLVAPKQFPLRRPFVMWQITSHKIGRLFLPLFALTGLAANVAEVACRSRRGGVEATAVLAIQSGFYALSTVGPRITLPGPAATVARLSRYLVSTNLATLRGLHSVLTASSSTLLARVERYQGIP